MVTYIINTYIAADCYADKYFRGNAFKYSEFIADVIYFVKDNINTIYITPQNTNMSFSYEYILLLFSFTLTPPSRKEIYFNGLRLLKKCGINLECKYHIYELDDDMETPNKIYVNIIECLYMWSSYYSHSRFNENANIQKSIAIISEVIDILLD